MSRVENFKFSEICLSLQSEEKKKRLNAMEKILQIITDTELNTQEKLEIWQILNKHMAKELTDSAEKCRLYAIEILKYFIESLPIMDKNIMYIIPILTRRLGSQEILEPSEEVRLNAVTLLQLIINIYQKHLAIYVDDFILILSRTIVDKYPNVKRVSCEAISELAKLIPVEFYTKSENVIKPILSNFTHQHFRVRVASVKAIGEVIKYGNSKSMEEISTPMAERLFDQSGVVRAAVIDVAGDWLVNLRDRYSWWHKLLPLLLTGLHDEIEEIRVNAARHWDAAGKLFLQENETDEKIKDKMDFLNENLGHYPPQIERPNLGCRIIVQRNISKLVGGIARELGDWMADIRVRSAQLLAVLVLNAEQDITQHIEKLIPSMYSACNDQDYRVVDNVALAGEYMGYFVPPDTFCRLIIPTLDDVNITTGHLTVFASILRGCERESLVPKLPEIGSFFKQSHVCRSKKLNYQVEILKSCEALLNVCQEDCLLIALDLFIVIFTIMAMSQDKEILIFAQELMTTLAQLTTQDLEELYSVNLDKIFNIITSTANTWSVYSPEIDLFKYSLTHVKCTNEILIEFILPILQATMTKESAAELRLKIYIILSDFFQRHRIFHEDKNLHKFTEEFLKEILLPGLIWTAGKASETLRTAAVGCLCAFFDVKNSKNVKTQLDDQEEKMINFFCDQNQFKNIFDQLRPLLVSLVDDNSRKTRLYALRALCLILDHGLKLSSVTDENVITIYPVIIKRLDDGSDDVRQAAIEALVFVWRALPENYDVEFGKSHLDYLYTSTIIHLDDPEHEFQNLMLDAMMELAKIHPEMLADKIIKCQKNFRNQRGLEKLLEHCHELLKK